jgi:hypothetical protein
VLWIATRITRLECTFREALLIVAPCILALQIPWVGLIAAGITFFLLLMYLLRAEPVEALIIAAVVLALEGLLLLL